MEERIAFLSSYRMDHGWTLPLVCIHALMNIMHILRISNERVLVSCVHFDEAEASAGRSATRCESSSVCTGVYALATLTRHGASHGSASPSSLLRPGLAPPADFATSWIRAPSIVLSCRYAKVDRIWSASRRPVTGTSHSRRQYRPRQIVVMDHGSRHDPEPVIHDGPHGALSTVGDCET